MAENEDRSREDLTEESSPYRLEEYRRKGIVSQSRELTGLVALTGCFVAAYLMAPQMGASLLEYMREVFRTDLSSRIDLGGQHVLRDVLMKGLKIIALVGLPVSLAGFILGVAASFSQIGSIFSTDPLTPDLNKINPIQGLKRMFSVKHALDGIRLTLKTTVVILVSYVLVKGEIFKSRAHLGEEPVTLFAIYGHAAKVIFFTLVGVLLLFAIIDFFMQKREYNKNLRLTKQEAKQEHKEREGDPLIKSRIRSIQREMARRRMMAAVKKADVVVTNPTHIAVALQYDKAAMAAPKVVAKGADFLAQKIKKVAADAGVPTVENVPLARTLYKTVKVGQLVPRALYQAVAEVLAYVYRLKNKGGFNP